jgi:uncharacterized protein
MEDKFQKHGAFSWFELMTADVEGAKAFYAKLFGWTFEKYPMGVMSYNVVKTAGEDAGGIMATPPEAQGMPPMWGIYVTVQDVDSTAKLARELGGKIIVPPTDIPDVGRFSVIQDPQGAVISAITYAQR